MSRETTRALATAVTELAAMLADQRTRHHVEVLGHRTEVGRLKEQLAELRDEVLIVEKSKDQLTEQIEAVAENRGWEFKSSQGAFNLIHQRLLELEQKEKNES
jgi:phage shock protein A